MSSKLQNRNTNREEMGGKALFELLETAEQLALEPTAERLAQIATLLGSVVKVLEIGNQKGLSTANSSLWETVPEIRKRISRLKLMLDAALRIRLGLARAATIGLAGYSTAGHSQVNSRPSLEATA
jgi:hypothetical protein